MTKILQGAQFRRNSPSKSIFMQIEIAKLRKISKLPRYFSFEIIEAQVSEELFKTSYHYSKKVGPIEEKTIQKRSFYHEKSEITHKWVKLFSSPISGGMESCSLFHLKFLEYKQK